MLLVSACLAGEPCRYDGKAKPVEEIRLLCERGEAVTACPEVLGGLPTPRPACERQPDGRVVRCDGADMTEAYRNGAEKALRIAGEHGCTCAILKARSPSCGKGSIYDGTFNGTLTEGEGVTAELFRENGIPVLTEEEYLRGLSGQEE